MKRIVLAATLAAVAVAVPAQASKPESPGAQGKAPSTLAGSKSKRCTPRSVAYVAFGAYVSSTLTQTQGTATTDNASDDRWSGTLVVDVKRTNRHGRADKGTQKEYTLTDARVRLADRNDDGIADVPVAGDRVRVQGKITRLARRCDSTGFTAEVKVRSVGFNKPKSAETPAPNPAPAP